MHVMDNKTSRDLEDAIAETTMTLQLVPPNQHRAKLAERAIQTWKCHFISGLSRASTHFPIRLWATLVEQANITLNLLHTSNIEPKHSAYSQCFGSFNYNSTPLAPPGTCVMVHEKPTIRASWGVHAKEGFYTGPAMKHY